MKRTQLFKGANVFMSRNLIPPEFFDPLLDSLKLNGAEIFLCCDPSRNGPDDFHVIASPSHEKFEDLRAKGCNLIGPQCVLSCAKENRLLPKGGFTCCLAMDGLKILASGFQMDEKAKIGKLVTSMGGVLVNKASSDVNFVVVKNVLAAKYKWALNIQKKPVVTLNWLQQCWNEHRVVPQEPFRVLPFSGLKICVTRIPADERKEIEKLISQNGGKYSAELTKSCTHLIADAAEGDKYKVARKWGHIHIITRKWFDQSIARKVCLNEESYPVHNGSAPLIKRPSVSVSQNSHENVWAHAIPAASAVAESDMPAVSQPRDSDLEAYASQNVCSKSMNPTAFLKGDSAGETTEPQESNVDGCIAKDSESENNDLYLSSCRIFLMGFGDSEMLRVINMVRRGGGSWYKLLDDKMTHIIVGALSESEKRQARSVAASGSIPVVTTSWLEDCDRERKKVPVYQKYNAHSLIYPRGPTKMAIPWDLSSKSISDSTGSSMLLGKNKEEGLESGPEMKAAKQKQSLPSLINGKCKELQRTQCDSDGQDKEKRKSSVFKGKTFCFSSSFPEDRRAEIVEWVNSGGGEVVNDPFKHTVHFTIECHGVISKTALTTCVSSHWVRSCLEDGCLLDVSSHILYSPIPCQTPLPGFQSFRLCVSQYEEKERLLMRNLCFVLGAKYVEKLTRKVTHLLCKFADGPKYEAACKWGIVSVTADWVYDCVRQNQAVSPDNFFPKKLTTQDQEAGCCLTSQIPTQFIPMTSRNNGSTFINGSDDKKDQDGCMKGEQLGFWSKKARLLEGVGEGDVAPMEKYPSSGCSLNPGEDNKLGKDLERNRAVPDVADAIEDLLKQTSKIQDLNSPGRISDKTLFPSSSSATEQSKSGVHSVTGLSKHWLSGFRVPRNDEICSPPKDVTTGTYGGFSESQTESQVVGYEEDLSGRQMLIDRVRTRSSLS